jgi:hypothetical protein
VTSTSTSGIAIASLAAADPNRVRPDGRAPAQAYLLRCL